jgi:uncharacterized membrane protein YedE/YeeE
MYRRNIVMRAMLPMGLVVWLTHWRLFENEHYHWSDFLLPIFAASLLGQIVARREQARLCELLGALGLSSVLLSVVFNQQYLILFSLIFGSIGLFLLPLCSSALRHNDPECSISASQTRNIALSIVAILCLLSGTCSMSWQEAILNSAILAFLVGGWTLVIAIGCIQGGKIKTGAEIGSITALVVTIFLTLLSLFNLPL